MAEVYDLLKPYLGADTYDELVRTIFYQNPNLLNILYEKLTGRNSSPVDGITIVITVIAALKQNDIGTFVSMMRQKE